MGKLVPDRRVTPGFSERSHAKTISTPSSSAHVEERDQELWRTLGQDCL